MESELLGVFVEKPIVVSDHRGLVRRVTQSDRYFQIKDVYITEVRKGVKKGWHSYSTNTLRYSCVVGNIMLVLWDTRKSSPTYGNVSVIYLGEHNYRNVEIPPDVFSAFVGLDERNLVVAAATEEFSEEGIIRKGLDELPFDWDGYE